MEFAELHKLKKGDKVAILSPSFAAPAKWPEVYELGLQRLRDVFGLRPVEFPATKKLGATGEARAADLIAAFENAEIKAVFSTLGGNDQVTYVKNLPARPFQDNPKPFFGYSDNTHFQNFLWLNGVPSYYGGAILTQFSRGSKMDDFTVKYLKHALFDDGEFELEPSPIYNDIGLDWGDSGNLDKQRPYEPNEGWYWDGDQDARGNTWGGCLESIDEILRHGVDIPNLEQFKNIVLFTETSEETPPAGYVFRVFRALGERGILKNVKAVIVGRPKAWEFDEQKNTEEKAKYKAQQREVTLTTIRKYNRAIPVIQNFDLGHTDPQICLPYGKNIRINSSHKKIFSSF